MTRDFVGYGATPPHPRWPGGARVAVNFVINFEEGSELSHPAGDGISETGLIESASTDAGNRRDRLGHLWSRLSLDQALRTRRG